MSDIRYAKIFMFFIAFEEIEFRKWKKCYLRKKRIILKNIFSMYDVFKM